MCSSFSLFRPLPLGGRLQLPPYRSFGLQPLHIAKSFSVFCKHGYFYQSDQIRYDQIPRLFILMTLFKYLNQLAFIKFLESWLEHRKCYMNVFLKQNKKLGHLSIYVFFSPSGPKIIPILFIFNFYCEIVLTYT